MNQQIELHPNQTVLVIGGYGFIGRQIVEQLERHGAFVIVGSRCVATNRPIHCRKVRLQQELSDEQYDCLLKEVDVVINSVGILRQRSGESYQQVHHHAVEKLAIQCAKKHIRYVHISALGIRNPVKSRFSLSKRHGEEAIKRRGGDWHIIKPSLVDGQHGYGAQWFRKIAQWPIHLAPANAVGKLTPIDVTDLGEITTKIALKTQSPINDNERVYEVGGKEFTDIFAYLDALSRDKQKPKLTIPAWLARASSHCFDLLHLTPYSYGHYELLKFDNAPKNNRAEEILGRPCRDISHDANATNRSSTSTVPLKRAVD